MEWWFAQDILSSWKKLGPTWCVPHLLRLDIPCPLVVGSKNLEFWHGQCKENVHYARIQNLAFSNYEYAKIWKHFDLFCFVLLIEMGGYIAVDANWSKSCCCHLLFGMLLLRGQSCFLYPNKVAVFEIKT